MASISDLDYTDNMAANKKPLLTDLRTALDSIETYINDSVKDNLLQLAKDCFPTASYAFDSDGNAQYTNSLYNKITAQTKYTGGNVTIATVGAWTDVDTSNAAIAITPELAGHFKATFQIVLDVVTSNATNEVDVRFRLTDGSTTSDYTPRIRQVTGVSGTRFDTPLSLMYQFSSLAASAQTIKLQYFITTSTATTIIVMANTNDPLCMQVEKI